ncbi:dihydroorotase [Natrarchaeobius oligotrophus]|uniref:Amidohydrolase-related domain-containing protein n=1 Tax=Natrarchaeobius chitinivorans TaxID=1679083 RepID=A0A3N6N0W6_NATCH|nr:dihydroorotase family protein [Natrarchaeobius chitinivorans]RQH02482.1 hypothetical protein EA472_04040 [Natrarchaeobius chitinivorans]
MSDVDIQFSGGRVYHAGELQDLTVGVTDGIVTHLVEPHAELEADERVDLDGEWLLPGFVDGHIHLREPGYVEKEGIESGTAAAVAGGVTTIVEMPNTVPPVLDVDRLRSKADRFDRDSHVDHAFFGAITEENVGTGDIRALADAGVTAFKTFMATSFGPLLMDDKGVLYRAFEEVADAGLPLYIHAEDEEYLDEFRARCADDGGMDAFFDSRPPIAETTAVSDVLDVVAETGTETVIAHVTTAEALARIRDARADGLPVHAEVTPYHLTFDRDDVASIGTHAIGTPPARDAENFERLWDHLESGDVQLLGSDHAPHQLEERDRPPLEVPPGMPQLETAVPAMLDAIDRGRLTVSQLVDLYAQRPARLHGLYPRKGAIRPGADADLVVVDPDREWTVDATRFESAADYSPFDGLRLTGMPTAVYQRGALVAEEMATLNEPGDGRRIS